VAIPASAPLVSIILVTRRAGFLPQILHLIERQDYRPRELVLVLHGLKLRLLSAGAQRLVEASADVILEIGTELPLGACLNEGIAVARGDVLAKMDDDDLYGPLYLSEAVSAMRAHGVPFVGKAEHLVYRVPQRELMLWRPGSSWMEWDYVMGPTLVFDSALGRSPGFRPIPSRVDNHFAEDCRSLGHRLLATSRKHFVLRRFEIAHHTWQPTEQEIEARGLVVRRGLEPDQVARLAGIDATA
jgi:glycosyltransferase involved in cell wall biosynthesis